MSKQIIVSETAFGFLQETLKETIHQLYDDPMGIYGEDLPAIHREFQLLQELCKSFELDFQQTVNELTTPYERGRLTLLLGHQTVSDELYAQFEALDLLD